MTCFIDGIAVWAPGLLGWPQTSAVLTGAQAYDPQGVSVPAASVLHAAERRRAPVTVRMALHVASEACALSAALPENLPSVFASSHGDTEISDYMCAELAQTQPALSPTKFHNSVHNAASGYWTIATQCRQPANAISAGVNSFAAGLLEASVLLADAPRSLLVAYDMTAPQTIQPLCPIAQPFAVALVLARDASAHSLARLVLNHGSTAPQAQQRVDDPTTLPAAVHGLYDTNPAARSLPLLAALARRQAGTLMLATQHWELVPCL